MPPSTPPLKPLRYVIVGPGRVGRNMAAYLADLGHAITLLGRPGARPRPIPGVSVGEDGAGAAAAFDAADIVAAALPDDGLAPWFAARRDQLARKQCIHFSGAAQIDGASGFHPLYSFPAALLARSVMETIAFAGPQDGPTFQDVFPRAPNPALALHAQDRAHYHALAVVTGNLAAYAWNQGAREARRRYNVDPGALFTPYFESVVARFAETPEHSLTGPIARRDRSTVKANYAALQASAPRLAGLYRAFLQNAWPDFENNQEEPPRR